MTTIPTKRTPPALGALALFSGTVYLALRALLVVGFWVRAYLHSAHYSALYCGIKCSTILLAATVVYFLFTAIFYSRLRDDFTKHPALVTSQIVSDCVFIALAYSLTGQVESDFHLAFVVPLITSIRLMRTNTAAITLFIIAIALLLSMIGALHLASQAPYDSAVTARRSLLQLTCSVFGPRLAFWGVITLMSFWLIGALENALREQTFYRSLVDAIPQKVFRKSMHGQFTYASPRFAKTLKLEPKDIVGKTDLDLYPHDLANKYQEDDRRLLATPTEIIDKVEEHQDRETGARTLVHVIKCALRHPSGEVLGIQGLFWNVEARDIEHSKMLAWFLHDTPKPLHLIRDNYLMQIRLAQQKRDERFIQIPQFCEKIDDVIRFVSAQFLAYGILGGGRFTWTSDDVIRPDRLFSSLTSVVRLNESGVAVRVEDCIAGAKCRSDAFKLTAVFWVLTDNAVKAIRRRCAGGSAQGRVRVQCRYAEGRFGFVVTDDGCGFTPTEKERMVKGARGENDVVSAFGSTGFGLRIVHRFSILGGGTWDCESPGQNRGATFTFWVPVNSIGS